MDITDLPDDFTDFLNSGQGLSYDRQKCYAGEVRMCSFYQINREFLWVSVYGTDLEDTDPHKGGLGYQVPAFTITEEFEEYPGLSLVYLPDEDLFGSYDLEHSHLLVYPGKTWTDIFGDPLPYLNSEGAEIEGLSAYLKPWPRYPYVEHPD